MKIGIAADHKGYVVKQMIKTLLIAQGYETVDFGSPHLDEYDDYTDFIIPLAIALHRNEVDRGVSIFSNATGACIIANKMRGVRAAVVADHFHAHQAVETNDVNLLCIPSNSVNYGTAKELIQLFVEARFESVEKDHRWLRKVIALETTNRFLWPFNKEESKRG